jgi:hypothetical protein
MPGCTVHLFIQRLLSTLYAWYRAQLSLLLRLTPALLLSSKLLLLLQRLCLTCTC